MKMGLKIVDDYEKNFFWRPDPEMNKNGKDGYNVYLNEIDFHFMPDPYNDSDFFFAIDNIEGHEVLRKIQKATENGQRLKAS